jgi:hypothetical protein
MRFNDTDAVALRAIVRKYGPYEVARELHAIMKSYEGQPFAFARKQSLRLVYATGLAMGQVKRLAA